MVHSLKLSKGSPWVRIHDFCYPPLLETMIPAPHSWGSMVLLPGEHDSSSPFLGSMVLLHGSMTLALILEEHHFLPHTFIDYFIFSTTTATSTLANPSHCQPPHGCIDTSSVFQLNLPLNQNIQRSLVKQKQYWRISANHHHKNIQAMAHE